MASILKRSFTGHCKLRCDLFISLSLVLRIIQSRQVSDSASESYLQDPGRPRTSSAGLD